MVMRTLPGQSTGVQALSGFRSVYWPRKTTGSHATTIRG